MLRENDFLKTIDGGTLLNSPLNSTELIVSHLIPQGIHLLGGSPKIESRGLCFGCVCKFQTVNLSGITKHAEEQFYILHLRTALKDCNQDFLKSRSTKQSALCNIVKNYCGNA